MNKFLVGLIITIGVLYVASELTGINHQTINTLYFKKRDDKLASKFNDLL